MLCVIDMNRKFGMSDDAAGVIAGTKWQVRWLKLGGRLFIFNKRETLNKNTPIAQHGYGKADKQNDKA